MDKIKEPMLPLLTKAKYYLPEHDVYGLTRQGTMGNDILVRYFHIYYDKVRASQEKNEYLKQLMKKERHLQKKAYVMFIASIVRNYLFQGLKKVSQNENDKKNYAVPEAISELEKITIVKNSRDVYIRRYGLTRKQKKN